MPIAPTQPVYPPVSGAPIQSVWGQAVADSVIQKFANSADRDAKWTNPPDGSYCITLSGRQAWVYWAALGGWKEVALQGTQRLGMTAIATGTLINSGAVTALNWDSRSSPDFGSGTDFTLPETGGWAMSVTVNGPLIPNPAFADVSILNRANGTTLSVGFIPFGKQAISVPWSGPMNTLGQVVPQVTVYNATPAAAYFTGTMTLTRMSP